MKRTNEWKVKRGREKDGKKVIINVAKGKKEITLRRGGNRRWLPRNTRKETRLKRLRARRVNVNYRGSHARQATSNNYFRNAPRLIQVVAATVEGGGGQA